MWVKRISRFAAKSFWDVSDWSLRYEMDFAALKLSFKTVLTEDIGNAIICLTETWESMATPVELMTLVESRMKSFPSPASALTGSAFRSLYFTRSHAQIWNASGPLNPGPDEEQCPSSPAYVQQPILGAASGSYFPTVRVYSEKERKWPWTTIIRRNWLPQYERIVCLEFLGRGSCGCSFAWWNPGNVLKWKWNLGCCKAAVDSCFLLSGLRKLWWFIKIFTLTWELNVRIKLNEGLILSSA